MLQNRIPDHIIRLRLLGKRDHNSAGMNDPGLFPRYLGYGAAQKFLMIQRNIRDHAYLRLYDVSSIEPPTHANFKHGEINSPPRKIFKCHRREHLEEAG